MSPAPAFALVAALLAAWPSAALAEKPQKGAGGVAAGGGESYRLPGDPQRGIEVFYGKGCVACHAVLGEGKKGAPDLGREPAGHLSAAQIAGVMWNHAPQMWDRIKGEQVDYPEMGQDEMADLFAFLYSIRYFDAPGDPDRGKALLTEKHCIDCHTIQAEGGRGGPDLGQWARYANPILWVQVMWNHGPDMERMMREKGVSWPVLRDDDMVDIVSYIRSAAPPQKTRVYLQPADPKSGAALFGQKGCTSCHALRGKGGRIGPDLGERKTPFPRTLTQFAGLMWNHAPSMWQTMKAQDVKRPQFSEPEMADLIAFLYSVRFFDEPGDPENGAKVFGDKKCETCHAVRGRGGQLGPDLSGWSHRMSPIAFAYVMWNHGPEMFKRMGAMGLPWPLFEGSEVVDLMEYLNAGAAE